MSASLGFLRRVLATARGLLLGFVALLRDVAVNVIRLAEQWMLETKHATYGIAVTRILLGFVILGTLLANFSTRLYTFSSGAVWTGQLSYPTSDFAKIWPFEIFSQVSTNDIVFTELYLLLAGLSVLMILGYRTRIVLVVTFILWVGFLAVNPTVQDQSDNLTRIVMIALFFTQPSERWSLDARRRLKFAESPGRNFLVKWWRFHRVLPEWVTTIAHNCAIVVLACQVFFVYVSGGLYKAGGVPWQNGTAIYSPISTAQFGTWPELSHLFSYWAPVVGFATALTLLVQVSFPLLLMRRGTRIFALIVMSSFHLGIAVLMGLPFFSLSMIAVDAIFIRDVTWRAGAENLRAGWRATKA